MFRTTLSRIALLSAACWLSPVALAEDDVANRIQTRLETLFPGVSIQAVTPAPMPGYQEVHLKHQGLHVVYASNDGAYFIEGDVLALNDEPVTNYTERTRKRLRLNQMGQLGGDDYIVYRAPQERHRITVFTDIDCGYCRKFHQDIPELNKRGITVRYLAFPRAGIGSESHEKAQTVWCQKDAKDALDSAKSRKGRLPDSPCARDVSVAEHFELGVHLGVQGTPTVLLEDGSLYMGYFDPDRMESLLNNS